MPSAAGVRVFRPPRHCLSFVSFPIRQGHTESARMGLTADDIAGHPGLHGILRQQSVSLLRAYEANPRLASVFGTQQRWLMAHVGFALHFRLDRLAEHRGLPGSRFFDVIGANGVGSRNTADAFLKEMLKYSFVQYGVAGKD